jgi:hypothetical protein
MVGEVAWIRRVRTTTGATAVQIAGYVGGRRMILKQVGSARTEAERGVLLRAAQRLNRPRFCAAVMRVAALG